jgi:Flp pilus assembly protein TadD
LANVVLAMTQMSIQQALQTAQNFLRAGQADEAETILRQIASQHPKNGELLHAVGIFALQFGWSGLAIELIQKAIAVDPDQSTYHCNLGLVLTEAGRLDDAIASCRRAIELRPDSATAFNNLGNALRQNKQTRLAIDALDNALQLQPRFPEAYNNLGNALQESGDLEHAIGAYRQALVLRPEYPQALCNLGVALRAGGQLDAAIAALRQAVHLKPDYSQGHNNLGNALRQKGNRNESLAAYEKAATLNPNLAEAVYNRADILRETGKLREAIFGYRQAIAIQPNLPEAPQNLANALHLAGEFAEATDILKKYVAQNPQNPDAHWNLALLLLLQGDFGSGWREYQWRTQVKEFQPLFPQFPKPLWDGKPLAGRRILLHTEQGFGDSLHFARYVQFAAKSGGEIILAAHPKIFRLFKSIPHVHQLIAVNQDLPPFDVHCPLPSLPFVLGLTEPVWNGPYLHSDSQLEAKFAEIIAQAAGKLKVGLVWSGRAQPAGRSIPLQLLAPLAHPRIQYYSLQIGEGREQIQSAPPGMNLIDPADQISDFADTAALMDQLDLIISIDTAAAQLAGALGKRVWTLLKFVPDWRWLLDREDSLWYPTMRLFRQKTDGDWQNPIDRMANALKELL